MIKINLIELVQEALAGGDAPAEIKGKYHPAVIEQYLDLVYQDVIQIECDKGNIDLLDTMVKLYKVIVQKDTERDQMYVDLPVTIMPLSPMNAGVRSISQYKGQQCAFAPVGVASAPIWDVLEATKIDPTGGYNLESGEDGNRAYFEQNNEPSIGDELMIKAIAPFSELDDNDNVFIPGGNNLKIFQAIYQIMLSRGNRDDAYNDNNSDQGR